MKVLDNGKIIFRNKKEIRDYLKDAAPSSFFILSVTYPEGRDGIYKEKEDTYYTFFRGINIQDQAPTYLNLEELVKYLWEHRANIYTAKQD